MMISIALSLVLALLAAVAGLAIGWICGNSKAAKARLEAENLKSRLELERENSMSQIESERQNSRRLLEAEREGNRRALSEMEKRFTEFVGHSTAQIRNAANEMIRDNSRDFAARSSHDIAGIVNPLKESIEGMKAAMMDNTLRQTEIGSSMRSTIMQMMEASRLTRESADNLARVFKGGSKVQGDWGEAILDELLQSQGFTPGVHYDIQASLRDGNGIIIRNESGSRMRPDVILHLDNKRDVIIDCKVSMSAFIDYVNADNEADRSRALASHIASINAHVRELAAKDYSSYIATPRVSTGYVIMFVPNSGALWLALNARPDLWRNAMEANVFIADEQTLFAALKIIRLTWTHIAQERNHEKVYALANEIIERVGMFMERFRDVGKSIAQAQDAYDKSVQKLQTGTQSIPASCAKLIKLGAKQSRRHPVGNLPEITDDDEEENIPENR